MIPALISRLLCAWFAFLLPCFSTFKALSHRPVSDPDLERLAKYWTVLGALVALEYSLEWFISWLPFYWEIKTLFLLFLSLPQIQGSNFIYDTYFKPFFTANEADLDATIDRFQSNTTATLQTYLASAFQFVAGLLGKAVSNQQGAQGTQPPQQSQPPAGGLNLESAMGLWRSYGPSVMGALGRGSQGQQPTSRPAATPQASSSSVQTNSQPNAGQRFSSSLPTPPAFPHSPLGTPLPQNASPSNPTPAPSFPEPRIPQ